MKNIGIFKLKNAYLITIENLELQNFFKAFRNKNINSK